MNYLCCMLEKIDVLIQEVKAYQARNRDDIDAFQQRFVHRKGELAQLFKDLKQVPAEKRQAAGKQLNVLKQLVEEKAALLQAAATTAAGQDDDTEDITLPPMPHTLGSLHPLRLIQDKVVAALVKIGFEVKEGPEIEDDYHNFSALNFPKDHPARDMQDTFFLDEKKEWLLRTHTSSTQVRVMANRKPPIRFVAPGRVFRNEAISARTHCMFHQVEGFYIDTDVSLADLKGTLYYLVQSLFGKEIKLRLRPSFFPFTEPSVEVDMSCSLCDQKGCNICKGSGWVEILGAGMIDPNVLKMGRINPEKYTGFAFGIGMERLAMLYYQINDLRLFTQNDVRFLRQFAASH